MGLFPAPQQLFSGGTGPGGNAWYQVALLPFFRLMRVLMQGEHMEQFYLVAAVAPLGGPLGTPECCNTPVEMHWFRASGYPSLLVCSLGAYTIQIRLL